MVQRKQLLKQGSALQLVFTSGIDVFFNYRLHSLIKWANAASCL